MKKGCYSGSGVISARAIKYCVPVILLCLAAPAAAVGISTYSFNSGLNCNGVYRNPDTGQTSSYGIGDDADYNPAAAQMSYTVNADNTVTDNVTGLMWRRCSQGKNDDATCTGTATSMTWEAAITSCEGETADFSDWRLPNAKELFSIVRMAGSAPYIDQSAFPGTVSSVYWTSTTYMPSTTNALNVNFGNGNVLNASKSTSNSVRCVRAGP